MKNNSFFPNEDELTLAIKLLFDDFVLHSPTSLPSFLPIAGLGEQKTLTTLAPLVLG
jgi:hypothetical protein